MRVGVVQTVIPRHEDFTGDVELNLPKIRKQTPKSLILGARHQSTACCKCEKPIVHKAAGRTPVVSRTRYTLTTSRRSVVPISFANIVVLCAGMVFHPIWTADATCEFRLLDYSSSEPIWWTISYCSLSRKKEFDPPTRLIWAFALSARFNGY